MFGARSPSVALHQVHVVGCVWCSIHVPMLGSWHTARKSGAVSNSEVLCVTEAVEDSTPDEASADGKGVAVGSPPAAADDGSDGQVPAADGAAQGSDVAQHETGEAAAG